VLVLVTEADALEEREGNDVTVPKGDELELAELDSIVDTVAETDKDDVTELDTLAELLDDVEPDGKLVGVFERLCVSV